MSFCNACRLPGACCIDFTLGRDFRRTHRQDEVQYGINHGVDLDTGEQRFQRYPTLRAIRISPYDYSDFGKYGADTVRWVFRCTALTKSGRCSIYKDRYEFCVIFEPRSDPLCEEWVSSRERK